MSAAPLQVGEPVPAVCGLEDMCRIFRLSASQFYRREQRGEFKRFELTVLSKSGIPKTWSGYRIARYLTGDSFSIAIKRAS